MTYDAQEISAYEGEPVEIYQFDREGVQLWRYTSADRDLIIEGNVYLAAPVKRNNVEASQDVERTSLKITMPADADFPEQFIASPPTDRIMATVRRYHHTDPTAELTFVWVGRVINVENKEHEAIISCESCISSLKRPTLRRVYQTTCPHVLYGDQCKVSKVAFGAVATLQSGSSGVTLISSTFAAQATGYYTGGYVEIEIESKLNRAFITKHIGSAITTGLPLQGAAVGLAVTVYPGCNHSLITCQDKFNNILNYGGFPYIPVKNPMTGTPIF